jgi:hypothetical protein
LYPAPGGPQAHAGTGRLCFDATPYDADTLFTTHSYSAAGVYIVTVLVVDAAGQIVFGKSLPVVVD